MPLFGFGRRNSPAEVYKSLRAMVLGLDAGKAHVLPTTELPHVWGIVVDWGVANGSATFVALADGTASMYTSSGGGVIGGQGHEAVREAGHRLLLAAEAAHDQLAPVDEATPPAPSRVTYWVHTFDGLRAVSHGGEGPPADAPWLIALGNAFQEFVTAIRVADEQRGR